jgi:hypothetical protein
MTRCDGGETDYLATEVSKGGDMTPVFDALAGKRFGTILIDPPWRFQNRTGKMAPDFW